MATSHGTPRARLLERLREPVLDGEPEVREVALLERVLEVAEAALVVLRGNDAVDAVS